MTITMPEPKYIDSIPLMPNTDDTTTDLSSVFPTYILLILTSFSDLPELYLIPSRAEIFNLIYRSNGVVLDCNDDQYIEDNEERLRIIHREPQHLEPFAFESGKLLPFGYNVKVVNMGVM